MYYKKLKTNLFQKKLKIKLFVGKKINKKKKKKHKTKQNFFQQLPNPHFPQTIR